MIRIRADIDRAVLRADEERQMVIAADLATSHIRRIAWPRRDNRICGTDDLRVEASIVRRV